jgi:hypothetical protein
MNRRENLTGGLVLVAMVAVAIQFFLGQEDHRKVDLWLMTTQLEVLELLERNPEQWAAICDDVKAATKALKDLQDFLEFGIRLHIELHPDATEERLALFIRAASLARSIQEHPRRTK